MPEAVLPSTSRRLETVTDDIDITARRGAIEKMLALFYAAYDREPPDALERKLKVGVWATALSGVPAEEIGPLAQRELAGRESAFFPVPADLLRRWNAQNRSTPEGAANVGAYLPYRPSPPPALPQPAPPLQIEPEELKRRLGFARPRAVADSPIRDDEELPGPSGRWSALLLDVARAGHIDLELCTPSQIAELRTFGHWRLARYPDRELSVANFAAAYAEFSTTRIDGLNTESTKENEKHKEF